MNPSFPGMIEKMNTSTRHISRLLTQKVQIIIIQDDKGILTRNLTKHITEDGREKKTLHIAIFYKRDSTF